MKQQPQRRKLAYQDPLYSFSLLVLMASILFILYLAVGLFSDARNKKVVTIGGSFVIGEVIDNGQTENF
jgi:hypothetical protein